VTRYYRSTIDVVCSPAMVDGEALGLIALGFRKVFFAELYSLVSSQTWPRVNV
jgi:hypothetical protein